MLDLAFCSAIGAACTLQTWGQVLSRIDLTRLALETFLLDDVVGAASESLMQNLVVSTGRCESELAKVTESDMNCCGKGAHIMCQVMEIVHNRQENWAYERMLH